MSAETELQRIADLNDAGQAGEALKALDKLERTRPGDPEVQWQRVLTLDNLGRQAEARAVAGQLVAQRGHEAHFWVTCSYLRQDDHAAALTDLERGLQALPGDTQLLHAKAATLRLLNRVPDACAIHDALVAAHPGDADTLLTRARFLEGCASTPVEGEAVMTDATGMKYAVAHLGGAIADYTAAIALHDDWKVRLHRARCLRQLGREPEALADFDAALAAMPPDSPARPFVVEDRKGPRAQIQQLLASTRADLRRDGAMTLQDQMADSVLGSVMDQVAAGTDLASALEAFVTEDPDDVAAVNIARQMFNVGNFPPPDLRQVDAREFPSYMRRHCDRAQRQLESAGFRCVGDHEAAHLTPGLGQRVLLRGFVSRDGTTCASAYALRPLWPGWLAWLLLWLSGKWRTMRVIDCESEAGDSFLATMNTGEIGRFDFGQVVQQVVLPAGAPIARVVAVHAESVEAIRANGGREPTRLATFADLVAMQTRMQAAKNAFRRSVGYATDDDLRRHLGDKYGTFAPKVRAKLAVMAAAVGGP